MKSIFLHTSGDYQAIGTPVKICFEGNVTKGVLVDSDSSKHIVCVKTSDGKLHWSGETHVVLDRPEPPPRGCSRRWG